MESLNVTEFLYENLNEFTNGFSEENFVSNFQFGKVYRGKMPPGIYGKEAKDVMVKIWDASNNRLYRVYHPEENRVRLAVCSWNLNFFFGYSLLVLCIL